MGYVDLVDVDVGLRKKKKNVFEIWHYFIPYVGLGYLGANADANVIKRIWRKLKF